MHYCKQAAIVLTTFSITLITSCNVSDFGNSFLKQIFRNNSHGAHVSSTTNTDCGTAIGGITDSFREEGWLRYDYYDYEERNTDQDLEADLPSILKELKITKRGTFEHFQ